LGFEQACWVMGQGWVGSWVWSGSGLDSGMGQDPWIGLGFLSSSFLKTRIFLLPSKKRFALSFP
jgi:hypothetical protein